MCAGKLNRDVLCCRDWHNYFALNLVEALPDIDIKNDARRIQRAETTAAETV